ncbi:MAG: hypothetical protein FWC12_11850 [Treponema sp.]|nr:hypothetical protein [Treponema sp.]
MHKIVPFRADSCSHHEAAGLCSVTKCSEIVPPCLAVRVMPHVVFPFSCASLSGIAA